MQPIAARTVIRSRRPRAQEGTRARSRCCASSARSRGSALDPLRPRRAARRDAELHRRTPSTSACRTRTRASLRLLGVASQDEMLRPLGLRLRAPRRPRARAQGHAAGAPARRHAVPFFEVRLVARGRKRASTSRSGSRRSACAARTRCSSTAATTAGGAAPSARCRRARRCYRRLAENSSDIISEYDAEWRLLYVSPEHRARARLPAEHLGGPAGAQDRSARSPTRTTSPGSSRSRRCSTTGRAPPTSSSRTARATPTASGAGCTRAAAASRRRRRDARSSW